MWHNCWDSWWFAWSWWRVYLRATFHWTRNPSSGVKCYIHFCNDIFCFDVCGGILPSQTFSYSLCSLLCGCSHCCCTCWAAFGEEANWLIRESFNHHFHPCPHSFCEWNITRWNRNSKSD